MNKKVSNTKPKLLLQVCCGPCATQAVCELSKDYQVTVVFWGSNIYPKEEYGRRLEALKTVCPHATIAEYDETKFLDMLADGLNKVELNEAEGGKRCGRCFEIRLQAAAEYAKANGFDAFTTSLTISPHKNAEQINQIGDAIGKGVGVEYLPTDLKANGGFAKSVALSRELGIYRQKYCGCRFSRK